MRILPRGAPLPGPSYPAAADCSPVLQQPPSRWERAALQQGLQPLSAVPAAHHASLPLPICSLYSQFRSPILMQASVAHTNLHSGAAGRQAGSAHSLTAMASDGGDVIPVAAAAAAAAGGLPGTSKRTASPSGAADEDGKRQRLASHAAAGPSGSSDDPLDAVPDAPMHLMRVRGIPACVCACLLLGCWLPHGHARHCSARQPRICIRCKLGCHVVCPWR